MPVPTFHISISGTVMALYGAVLATITGAVQTINFLRDRPKMKMFVQKDMYLVLPSGIRVEGRYTAITVANAGRRPVTIVNVGGYRLFPEKGFVIEQCTPPLPHELTEGKHLTAFVNESEFDFADMESWEASDAL